MKKNRDNETQIVRGRSAATQRETDPLDLAADAAVVRTGQACLAVVGRPYRGSDAGADAWRRRDCP
jgi:hypothetical protein